MNNHTFIINQQLHVEYDRVKKDYLELKNNHRLLFIGGTPEKAKNQIQPKKSFLSEWKQFRMDKKTK